MYATKQSENTKKFENVVSPPNGEAPNPSVVLGTLEPDAKRAADELLATVPQAELAGGATRSISSFPDARIIVVEEGFVVLRGTDPSGRGVVICYGGPGTFIPLIDSQHSIAALLDSRLMVIPGDVYEGLLELPGAARALLRKIDATLLQKQRTILVFASIHHVDRVRQKLLQLASDYGHVGRDGVLLQLSITHDMLGEMIGSARETVTRAIDELEKEGFFRRQGRTYVLLVPPDELER